MTNVVTCDNSKETRNRMKFREHFLSCVIIIVVLVLGMFSACNSDVQNHSNNSNEQQNISGGETEEPPIEEYVSVDELWNTFFTDTSFENDFQSAYNIVCEKALPELSAEVKQAKYDALSNEITLTANYYEYDADRTGTIIFEAPNILTQIESSGEQAVVLEIAGYFSSKQIKESEIESTKTQIARAIEVV